MIKTHTFNIRKNSDKETYDDIIFRYTGMYFKLFNNLLLSISYSANLAPNMHNYI